MAIDKMNVAAHECVVVLWLHTQRLAIGLVEQTVMDEHVVADSVMLEMQIELPPLGLLMIQELAKRLLLRWSVVEPLNVVMVAMMVLLLEHIEFGRVHLVKRSLACGPGDFEIPLCNSEEI